jgi:hypothetical protein
MRRVIAHGRLPALAAALALAVLAPNPSQAGMQQSAEDTRWLPWLGCWEPAAEPGEEGSEILVCIEALDDGVEISTWADGEVMGTEWIRADGRAQPALEGGCEGTREARWSADQRRVYILSELSCAEGVDRTTSGVLAITGDGQYWTEIHTVRSGEREPVLAVRSFQPAAQATLARHDHRLPESVTGRELAIRTSRMAASSPLAPRDVEEAVALGGGELASALVLEMGHGFDLDARTLRALVGAGVPEEVLDMMVAVTWPERFQVEAGQAELDTRTAARDDRRAYRPWPGPAVAWGYGSSFRSCGFGVRYCYDPFYHGLYSWGYAYGGGYWGPGWFPGNIRYVYVTPPTVRDRGAVSPGGYTAPGSTGRTARPGRAGSAPPPPSSQQSPRPTRNDPPSAGSGGSRVTPSGGHSSGGSNDRRPARPRGGGDGR